jgi:hypothetical protein
MGLDVPGGHNQVWQVWRVIENKKMSKAVDFRQNQSSK